MIAMYKSPLEYCLEEHYVSKMADFISELISKSSSESSISYYHNKDTLSVVVPTESFNKEIDNLTNWEDKGEALNTTHFYEKLLKLKIIKISKNVQNKVTDNKTFMKNLLLLITNKYKIPFDDIFGIIAVNSQNLKRTLNLTYYYNSLIISNGLFELSDYDEFFVYTTHSFKERNIEEDVDKVLPVLHNFSNKIFFHYIYNKLRREKPVEMIPLRIEQQNIEVYSSYSLETNNVTIFIPVHLYLRDCTYPFYGHFINRNFSKHEKYFFEPLGSYLTGNVDTSICTGQESNATYYGLTTLETYNSTSSYTQYNIKDYTEALRLAKANVRLSIATYLEEDSNESPTIAV